MIDAITAAARQNLLGTLLTLRGTPHVYLGDEIGMTNTLFERLDDFEDANTTHEVQEKGRPGRNARGITRGSCHYPAAPRGTGRRVHGRVIRWRH